MTLNASLMPVKNNVTSAYNNNNYKKYPSSNLNGMPQADVFEKSGVSFKGGYDPVLLGLEKPMKIGKDFSKQEMIDFNMNLINVVDNAWDYITREIPSSHQQMNIVKPGFQVINSRRPENGWNTSGGKNVQYDWVNNTILIDRSYVPNMLLISKGSVVALPQKLAGDFVTEQRLNPDRFKEVKPMEFGEAIENSRSTGNLFYMRLSPQDTAELLGPAIAHEMSHMVATHLALNTFDVGGQAFRPFFERNSERGDLTYYGAQNWEDSFPAGYNPKKPNAPLFNQDDVLRIKGSIGGRAFNASVEHKDLMKYLFQGDYNQMSNPLELWAAMHASSYCLNRLGSLNNMDKEPVDVERMKLLYGHILEDYDKEELERAEALDVFKNTVYY